MGVSKFVLTFKNLVILLIFVILLFEILYFEIDWYKHIIQPKLFVAKNKSGGNFRKIYIARVWPSHPNYIVSIIFSNAWSTYIYLQERKRKWKDLCIISSSLLSSLLMYGTGNKNYSIFFFFLWIQHCYIYRQNFF